MKFCLPILAIFLILFSFPSRLDAAGFQLKTVGSLNVEGATLNHLWYTNGQVSFTGTALENAEVTATIDGVSETVTADASGNWSYTTSLAEGDHQVSFTSNEAVISFTLTIGEAPEGIGSLPTTETPTVGIITPTLASLFLGGLLVLLPFFLVRRNPGLN